MGKFLIAGLVSCLALTSCGPKGKAGSEPAAPAAAEAPATDTLAIAKPQNIGDCVQTSVSLVGPRLEGVAGSGSTIVYANGMSQVSYDAVPGIDHTQVGDEVRVCLVSVPENCPAGDDRGRVYSGTNARTSETWNAPDSQHSCGGA